jgi:hypothetical protein
MLVPQFSRRLLEHGEYRLPVTSILLLADAIEHEPLGTYIQQIGNQATQTDLTDTRIRVLTFEPADAGSEVPALCESIDDGPASLIVLVSQMQAALSGQVQRSNQLVEFDSLLRANDRSGEEVGLATSGFVGVGG